MIGLSPIVLPEVLGARNLAGWIAEETSQPEVAAKRSRAE
jgi:hypothetical protein